MEKSALYPPYHNDFEEEEYNLKEEKYNLAEEEYNPQEEEYPQNEITWGYGRVLRNKILSDVKFIVGEQRKIIQAHKIFLASASLVFEKMFLSEPSKAEFTILDVDPDVFEILLEYMYNQDIQHYIEPEKFQERVFEVFSAAQKYGLKELATQAKDSLMNCVSKTTALQVLKLAACYKDEDLEKEALDEICRSAHEILETEEILTLDIQLIKKFIGLDELASKDEIQIYEALVRWAEARCKRGGAIVSSKYCRSYLDSVIPLIRFPLISESDFASRVAFQGILSRDERVDMALYYKIMESDRSEACLADFQFNTKPRKYWQAASFSVPNHEDNSCSDVKVANIGVRRKQVLKEISDVGFGSAIDKAGNFVIGDSGNVEVWEAEYEVKEKLKKKMGKVAVCEDKELEKRGKNIATEKIWGKGESRRRNEIIWGSIIRRRQSGSIFGNNHVGADE